MCSLLFHVLKPFQNKLAMSVHQSEPVQYLPGTYLGNQRHIDDVQITTVMCC